MSVITVASTTTTTITTMITTTTTTITTITISTTTIDVITALGLSLAKEQLPPALIIITAHDNYKTTRNQKLNVILWGVIVAYIEYTNVMACSVY